MNKTWENIAENEKNAWEERFVELAEDKIPYYFGNKDRKTDRPWCMPWIWGAPYMTPEAFFEQNKDELRSVTDEDFEYMKDCIFEAYERTHGAPPNNDEDKQILFNLTFDAMLKDADEYELDADDLEYMVKEALPPEN